MDAVVEQAQFSVNKRAQKSVMMQEEGCTWRLPYVVDKCNGHVDCSCISVYFRRLFSFLLTFYVLYFCGYGGGVMRVARGFMKHFVLHRVFFMPMRRREITANFEVTVYI